VLIGGGLEYGWFEREVTGDRFRVRVGAGVGWWSIEVGSLDGDVGMSFRASCRTPKSCLWIHNMFLVYLNAAALFVENPDLVSEAMQFIQNLYRTVTEEEMAEILKRQAAIDL